MTAMRLALPLAAVVASAALAHVAITLAELRPSPLTELVAQRARETFEASVLAVVDVGLEGEG